MSETCVSFEMSINFKVPVEGASRRLNSQFIKAPQSGADSTRRNRGKAQTPENKIAAAAPNSHLGAPPAWPNHSLKRTHCGGPPFGL